MTVFQVDGGWKFCIADTDRDGSIHFSDPYPTEVSAKIEVIAFIEGRVRKLQTNREIRLEALGKGASKLIENEAVQQAKLEQTISKILSRIPRPTALALAKLRKLLADQAGATSSLHAELIAARASDDNLSKGEVITARYWDMCWKIDEASGALKRHGPGGPGP